MPYVDVTRVDRVSCQALADARWAAMLAAKPDLAPAISLQRKLIALVLDLAVELGEGRQPRLSLPPRYVTTKLGSGIPALVGEPVQVPVGQLAPTLSGLVTALAEGGGGEATRLIRVALDEGTVDPGALMTLALRREQGALKAFATKVGLGHDLLWLVCDLAAGPFAHALLASVFGTVGTASSLRPALDSWVRGYCPLCGSWPGYTEHRGDLRRLRCSFCAASWDVPFGACIYCSRTGDSLATIAPNPHRPHRALETCTGCKGYSKIVDEAQPLPFPLLPLADLDSMDLDIMAMQRGFARPAIKQFTRR